MELNDILENFKPHTAGIYAMILTKDGVSRRYVGQSLDVRKRLMTHFQNFSKGTHANRHMQYFFNKHGLESFTCELLFDAKKDERTLLIKADRRAFSDLVLTPKENFYIQEFKAMDTKFGFNKKRGLCSTAGGTTSVETRLKMSINRTGENNGMYGKTHTAEVRKRLSECNTGDKHPMFGRPVSLDTRTKLSTSKLGSLNPMFGTTISDKKSSTATSEMGR